MRQNNKEAFDEKVNIQSTSIKEDDLVLMHNTKNERDMLRNNTLRFQWLGPYHIQKTMNDRESYYLEKLDGTEIKDSCAGDQIRRYYPQTKMLQIEQEEENETEENESRMRTWSMGDIRNSGDESVSDGGEETATVNTLLDEKSKNSEESEEDEDSERNRISEEWNLSVVV